ncbi:MAG: hypothetical protein WD904_07225 [Dehalococcoidia bacterium]
MPEPVGRVLSVRFDEVEEILAAEGMFAVESMGDRRLLVFHQGLRVGRDLVVARADKRYEGYLQVVLTALYFKVVNDLLAACLLIRCGYALQSYPCMRAAFEAAEMAEYLLANASEVNDCIRGGGRFERNLDWIRAELPDTATRRKAYGFFNYFAHNNMKGMNVYMRHEDGDVVIVHAGAQEPPHDALRPYVFATTLLAYATRTLWQADVDAIDDDWVKRFNAFDQSTNRSFSEVGEPPNDKAAAPTE